MEDLKKLEKSLFAVEFDNEPKIDSIIVNIGDNIYFYKCKKAFDKYYIVADGEIDVSNH